MKKGQQRVTREDEKISFEKLIQDTPENAYLLGLLWADASIARFYTLALELKSVDFKNIESLLHTDLGWRFTYRERPNRQPQSCGHLNNKPYLEFLKAHDYKEKTYLDPQKILSWLPENLHQHWWHGYFDGDGNIYVNHKWSTYQITFCGSKDLNWKSGIEMLHRLGIQGQVNRVEKTNSYSTLRFTKRAEVRKFLEWIHRDTLFGLLRKRVIV